MNKLHNPTELYSLNTIEFNDISCSNGITEITNFFWVPNQLLLNILYNLLDKENINTNILDVGCSVNSDKYFKKATHLLDFSDIEVSDKIVIKLDLDFDKFNYNDNYFNFVYCRHTLEDIQNPQNAFNEITRISKNGYIETPSPLIEIMNNIDCTNLSYKYKGYVHHRYIVWTDLATNTLKFLPKYPIVEYIKISNETLQKFIYLLNNYAVYWNNYYIWDMNRKPNIVVYRNDINMNILKDYENLLIEAIFSSITNTNEFINYLTASSSTAN